jgi:hypothetical protein
VKISNQDRWDEWVKNNQDPYGSGVIRFAERWADIIERDLAAGVPFATAARDGANEADTEGITGFMYGAAVTVLATSWERGDQLRRWHNLDTQIRDEGERANREGGVLNPAVLTTRAD